MPNTDKEQLGLLAAVRKRHHNELGYSGVAANIIDAEILFNVRSSRLPVSESSKLYVFRSRLNGWPKHRLERFYRFDDTGNCLACGSHGSPRS